LDKSYSSSKDKSAPVNDLEHEDVYMDIVDAYRKVINDRYDYVAINGSYQLPDSFTEAKFDALRSYFLTHIYPPPEQRAQLNAAFDNLEDHIGNPRYLLSILMDSVGILFKYGRHLPKILKTGLKAMQSFKKANRFEHQLAQAAVQDGRKPPFSKEDIAFFTSQLSEDEVYGFINDSLSLFETLHDHELVKRVIDIVNQLISKMLARPNVYPSSEIEALKLGRNLIVEGFALFESLTELEQTLLFDMIVEIEKNALRLIFYRPS